MQGLRRVRDRCARVAEAHARIEEDLNEGLRVIRNHFQDTASVKTSQDHFRSVNLTKEFPYRSGSEYIWYSDNK